MEKQRHNMPGKKGKPSSPAEEKDIAPFWEQKRLRDMTRDEWESLCDRCGLCCVHKIEDEDTGEIFCTRFACELLDLEYCTCREYERRRKVVPDCARLTADNLRRILPMLPATCAYRRLAEGKPLPAWHPLVTDDPASTRQSGMSARDRLMPLGDLSLLEALSIEDLELCSPVIPCELDGAGVEEGAAS